MISCSPLNNMHSFEITIYALRPIAIIAILTQKEKVPAYTYTPLVSGLGKKLVLRDPEQAWRQADLLEGGITFEPGCLEYF